jgi:hypothetical protein
LNSIPKGDFEKEIQGSVVRFAALRERSFVCEKMPPGCPGGFLNRWNAMCGLVLAELRQMGWTAPYGINVP